MATTAKTDAAYADAAASAGLPQLDFSTFGNQIFWLVVALIATYLILSRIALPRIAAILADRQNTITGDLADAEDFNAKAKEAEQAYKYALASARSNAAAIIAETKAQMTADLNAAIAKADEDIAEKSQAAEAQIAQIRETAVENIRSVANDIASDVAGAVGVPADDAALKAAIDARMKG